jgi:hypothetical protein
VTGRLGKDAAEDTVPLVVGQLGGVELGLLMRLEGHVGPGMMAVGGDVEPARSGAEETGEVLLHAGGVAAGCDAAGP